ncbi:hypothetical protein R6Q59_021027, partial [Mikania micrantha]
KKLKGLLHEKSPVCCPNGQFTGITHYFHKNPKARITLLSQDEVNLGTALKFKITQTEGKRLQVIATSHEKVNVDVTTEDVSGHTEEKQMVVMMMMIELNVLLVVADAESTCEIGYEDEIHRLELQAYRCTIEALHASGPLTWEKETM